MKKRAVLSDDLVAGLTPGTREYAVWDRDLPAFGVRVRATGHRSYVLMALRDGRTRRVTLGSARHMDCAAARRAALAHIGKAAADDGPAANLTPNLTLAELVEGRWHDGRSLSLGHDDPQLGHCDYAFASTAHGAQGRTAQQVIAVMDGDHAALSNQKTFYVEISRARDGVTIVTDDRLQLADTLAGNSGEMVSALEAIGEISPRELPTSELSPGELPTAPTREVGRGRVPDLAAGPIPVEPVPFEPTPERHDEPPPPTHEAEYGEEVRLEPERGDGMAAAREREPEPTKEKTPARDIDLGMGL